LLFAGLYRMGIYRPKAGWGALGLRLLVANALMVLVILWLGGITDSWLEWSVWQRAWQLGILCVAGASVYFVTLVVCGLRPRHLRH
jgi:putative peptidoglycan lipid II flippase